MLHPYATVEGIFGELLDGAKGPHKCLASHEFYETDLARGFVRGFSFETQRGYGPVATALRGTFTGRIPQRRRTPCCLSEAERADDGSGGDLRGPA